MLTFETGGSTRYYRKVTSNSELKECVIWARDRGAQLHILGGGSNTLVADSGYNGLVVALSSAGDDFSTLEILQDRPHDVLIRVGAAQSWDAFVVYCVERGYGGVECLSGIPGTVGAAPIQNIGAYGQEVATLIQSVEVFCRKSLESLDIDSTLCDFSYRHSKFKTQWRHEYIVKSVSFRLSKDKDVRPSYPALVSKLSSNADLKEIRDHVLDIRRKKSMVYDSLDPNHRSAGSFFVNPILGSKIAQNLADKASTAGKNMPLYPLSSELTKLSAAWLIEDSGFERGYRFGQAGLSTNHTLAIINRGGASTSEILELAALIRREVFHKFGVVLAAEPVMLGFEAGENPLLQKLE